MPPPFQSEWPFGASASIQTVDRGFWPVHFLGVAGAFRDRWIDWHPADGKRSGAYASGSAYDVHPYVLLNYNGDYEGVSTLTHEMGHAMHSYFSNKRQPFETADYSIRPRSLRAISALAYSSLMCLVQTSLPATLSSTVRPALFR